MADNQDNVDVEGDALAPPEPDGDAVDTGDIAPPHEELAPPDSQAEELAPPDSQAEELAPPEATPDELAPPEVQADELDAPETQTDELQPPDTQADELQMPDVAIDELPDDEMGGYEQSVLDAEPTDTSVEDAIEERMPEPIEKDYSPKLLTGDGNFWSPSMSWGVRYLCLGDANFYRTFASIQYVDDGNYWYQERSGARVTVGWLACPCDGILTGLTVSTNMGTPLRGALTYFSVCQAGAPADAVGIWHSQKLLAGAPVTGGLTYQESSDINVRNAVYSSTDGTAAVTKGMLLALSAKCNCVAHTDYWRGATATFIIEKI